MTGGTLRRLGGFAPGLVTLLGYDRSNLRFDIVAGLLLPPSPFRSG